MLQRQSVETGVDIAKDDVGVSDRIQNRLDLLGRQARWKVDARQATVTGRDGDGFLSARDSRPSQPTSGSRRAKQHDPARVVTRCGWRRRNVGGRDDPRIRMAYRVPNVPGLEDEKVVKHVVINQPGHCGPLVIRQTLDVQTADPEWSKASSRAAACLPSIVPFRIRL